jgi:hypothetical protein
MARLALVFVLVAAVGGYVVAEQRDPREEPGRSSTANTALRPAGRSLEDRMMPFG